MTAKFVTAATFAMWIMSGPASAQTPPDDIQRVLKPGQDISVIDEQGHRFRGKVAEVSGDGLTIAKGRDRTIVRYDSLVRIDEVDDLQKGTKIGMLVAAGLFAVEAWAAQEDGFTLNPAGYALIGALYCGAGAAIGAGIDALIGGDRLLYQRSAGSSRFSVAPVFGRSRVGARVGISW